MQLTLSDDVTVHLDFPGNPDAVFEEVCRNHPDLRVEQTRTGEIVIMSPAGNESSNRNAKILAYLVIWAGTDARRSVRLQYCFCAPGWFETGAGCGLDFAQEISVLLG